MTRGKQCGSSACCFLRVPFSWFVPVLVTCVRALPAVASVSGALSAKGLGPGGRRWRPAVAIRWGSYFRERVLFFLAWADSVASVPPVSCWKELWPPAYWEVNGRKRPWMSQHSLWKPLPALLFAAQYSRAHLDLVSLAQTPQCYPLPQKALPASGCAGQGQPPIHGVKEMTWGTVSS